MIETARSDRPRPRPSSHSGTTPPIRPWNDPRTDIERKLRVDPELFLVAVEEDLVVGSVMAGYEGHRGWINYLAVDPSRRRQGLGTRLMDEAEGLLAERGCPKINLQIRSRTPT